MSPYQLTIATLTCINVIVALGLYVTITSGQLSNAHAAIMGIGGYVAGYLALHGTGLAPTLVVGAAAGGIVGLALATLLLRVNHFYLAIATLAAGEASVTLANNLQVIGGANGLSGIPLRVGFSVALPSAIVLIVGVRFWEKSLGGYISRALGEDYVAAQACGVNPRRVRVLCFLTGGAMAGFAGALQAQSVGIVVPTSLSFQAEVALFFFVGIGGMSSYSGALVGGVLISILPEVFRFSIYDRYLYFGLALAAMMVLRPFGLVPRVPLGQGVLGILRDQLRVATSRISRGEGDHGRAVTPNQSGAVK